MALPVRWELECTGHLLACLGFGICWSPVIFQSLCLQGLQIANAPESNKQLRPLSKLKLQGKYHKSHTVLSALIALVLNAKLHIHFTNQRSPVWKSMFAHLCPDLFPAQFILKLFYQVLSLLIP